MWYGYALHIKWHIKRRHNMITYSFLLKNFHKSQQPKLYSNMSIVSSKANRF